MGFGTLFIGSFFLLNISYYGYTDIIAAMVMMMGLYKLSSFNKEFKWALFTSYAFAALSLFELASAVFELFTSSQALGALSSYLACVRYIVIFALTYLTLTAIYKLADEVDDRALAVRARRRSIFSFFYLILAIFELPMIGSLLGSAGGYVYFALVILYLVLTVFFLVSVYRAYMGICMPEDKVPKDPKPSKFGFINRMREHEEKKAREYAEYQKEKQEKRKARKTRKK